MFGRLFWSSIFFLSVSSWIFTAWLWWHSYHAYDAIRFDEAKPIMHQITSVCGRLSYGRAQCVEVSDFCVSLDHRPGEFSHDSYPRNQKGVRELLNDLEAYFRNEKWVDAFAWNIERRSLNDGSQFVSIGIAAPHWLFLIALSPGILWPLIRIRRFRLHRRKQAGLCVHCGYDLRGTPERCPECGTVPAARPSEPGAPATGSAGGQGLVVKGRPRPPDPSLALPVLMERLIDCFLWRTLQCSLRVLTKGA